MQDGMIRVNSIKDDYTDLSDYFLLPMHDNLNGIISKLELSYDKKFLFSIGNDGNLFSYKTTFTVDQVMIDEPIEPEIIESVDDIEDREYLSLQQQKVKNDYDRRMKIAEEKKEKNLNILKEYKEEFLEIKKL